VALFFAVVIFAYVHECMHFLAFKMFKIEFETKLVTKHHIPIAYYVYSKYFNVPFYKMTGIKQQRFFMIAILPYFMIFPIAYFMTTLDNIYMTMVGLVIIITHFVNLPLEFIKV
jgi:hypothetical protein